MSRELKFRLIRDGKIVGYEKWYPGQGKPTDVTSAEPCWLYSRNGGKTWNPTPIPHRTKDQFTGLPDKDGVDIYEGDVLEFPSGHYETDKHECDEDCDDDCDTLYENSETWMAHPGCEIVKWAEDNRGGWHGTAHTVCTGEYDAKIIGNIHENPELLK